MFNCMRIKIIFPHLPSLYVEVEEHKVLAANCSHVVYEVGEGNVVLHHYLQYGKLNPWKKLLQIESKYKDQSDLKWKIEEFSVRIDS